MYTNEEKIMNQINTHYYSPISKITQEKYMLGGWENFTAPKANSNDIT